MRPLISSKHTETKIKLGNHSDQLEYLGVKSRTPLGTVSRVIPNLATGEVTLQQTRYTLVEKWAIDWGNPKFKKKVEAAIKREEQNAEQRQRAQMQALVEGEWTLEWDAESQQKADFISLVEQRKQDHKQGAIGYALLHDRCLSGTSVFYEPGLIKANNLFCPFEEVKRFGQECQSFLDDCVTVYDQPQEFAGRLKQYNALVSRFFRPIAELELIFRVKEQMCGRHQTEKWSAKMVANSSASAVIAIFYIRPFFSESLAQLIELNGNTILKKLSKKNILAIFENAPLTSDVYDILKYVIGTPILYQKLTEKDRIYLFCDMKRFYPTVGWGALFSGEQLAELILSHRFLIKDLSVDYSKFLELVKEAGSSPWRNKLLSDAEVWANLAPRDIIEIITNYGDQIGDFFIHPAPSEIFIRPQRPSYKELDEKNTYRLNFIFAEQERKLYYIGADGDDYELTHPVAVKPFNLERFIDQLSELKVQQQATTHVYLDKQAVERLILQNNGQYYTSEGVLRLSEACIDKSQPVCSKDLTRVYACFDDHDYSPDYDKSSFKYVQVKLMEACGWQHRSCSEVYPQFKASFFADKSTLAETKQLAPAQTVAPELEEKIELRTHIPIPTLPPLVNQPPKICQGKRRIVWGVGLNVTALGTVGLALIKTGVLADFGSPYLWPVALGLAVLGISLLLGLGLSPLIASSQRLFQSATWSDKPMSQSNGLKYESALR